MLMRIASGTLFIATLSLACGGKVGDSKSADSSLQDAGGGTSIQAPIGCMGATLPPAGTLFAQPKQAFIEALAVDDTNLYLYDSTGIQKIPLSGGALTTIASLPVPENLSNTTLRVGSGNVFFASNRIVGSVPISGGSVATISSTDSFQAASLELSPTNVYWVDASNTIFTAPRGGGPASAIATESQLIGSLAIDATNLYWHVDPEPADAPFALRGISLAGGAPFDVVADTKCDAFAMAAGDNEIFYNGLNGIGEVSTSGGATTEIFRDYSGSNDLTIDDGNLYWTAALYDNDTPGPRGIFRASLVDQSCGQLPLAQTTDLGAWVVGASSIYWVSGSDIYSVAK